MFMKTKVIIFDLWETLGTKNSSVASRLRDQFDIEKTPDYPVKYENALQLEEWKSKEKMAQSFLRSFNINESESNIAFIVDTQEECIKRAIMFDGMKELLLKLKKNYMLALISNTTVFDSKILNYWGIENIFDTIVLSWQIKSLKPEKKNFEAVATALGVEFGECLFVDDSEKNIDAARTYGLIGITFESVAKLNTELMKMEIL